MRDSDDYEELEMLLFLILHYALIKAMANIVSFPLLAMSHWTFLLHPAQRKSLFDPLLSCATYSMLFPSVVFMILSEHKCLYYESWYFQMHQIYAALLSFFIYRNIINQTSCTTKRS